METQQNRRLQLTAYLFVLLQGLIYGFGDPISKAAYEILPVYSLLSLRYLLAVAVNLLVVKLIKNQRRSRKRKRKRRLKRNRKRSQKRKRLESRLAEAQVEVLAGVVLVMVRQELEAIKKKKDKRQLKQ